MKEFDKILLLEYALSIFNSRSHTNENPMYSDIYNSIINDRVEYISTERIKFYSTSSITYEIIWPTNKKIERIRNIKIDLLFDENIIDDIKNNNNKTIEENRLIWMLKKTQ